MNKIRVSKRVLTQLMEDLKAHFFQKNNITDKERHESKFDLDSYLFGYKWEIEVRKEKTCLFNDVLNDKKVREAFPQLSDNLGAKYLYSKRREFEKENVRWVEIKGFHAKIYFVYLGYRDFDHYLKENPRFNDADRAIQKEILSNNSEIKNEGKDYHQYLLIHYSQNRNEFVTYEVKIGFKHQKKHKQSEATYCPATIANDDISFEGKATIGDDHILLFFDCIRTGISYSPLSVLLSVPSVIGPNKFDKIDKLFGTYTGIAHENRNNLAGVACLLRLDKVKSDLPKAKQFLLLHSPQTVLKYEISPKWVFLNDLESKTKFIIGKYKLLFVNKKNKIVIDDLKITPDSGVILNWIGIELSTETEDYPAETKKEKKKGYYQVHHNTLFLNFTKFDKKSYKSFLTHRMGFNIEGNFIQNILLGGIFGYSKTQRITYATAALIRIDEKIIDLSMLNYGPYTLKELEKVFGTNDYSERLYTHFRNDKVLRKLELGDPPK